MLLLLWFYILHLRGWVTQYTIMRARKCRCHTLMAAKIHFSVSHCAVIVKVKANINQVQTPSSLIKCKIENLFNSFILSWILKEQVEGRLNFAMKRLNLLCRLVVHTSNFLDEVLMLAREPCLHRNSLRFINVSTKTNRSPHCHVQQNLKWKDRTWYSPLCTRYMPFLFCFLLATVQPYSKSKQTSTKYRPLLSSLNVEWRIYLIHSYFHSYRIHTQSCVNSN